MTLVRSQYRLRLAALAAVTALCLSTGVALAEQVTVEGRNVEVVEDMASDAATVEMVPPGNKLEVIGKTGRWLKVRTPTGKQGYVPETMVKRNTSGFDLTAITGGPRASDVSAANAGRGLTEQAGTYARSRGYRTDGPDKLVALRQQAKPDLKKFKEQGKVGIQR
ncbi:SH3 domain-containing protein [Humisphaera borealis]|uniref:SH3 domain-containing protein n=1 Tax=Humisphaera borealis TaxID=2807512 RepID=A0A7M2X1P7_9BACT|nr:SH3 domain-containing protein [Humisphaera borealis]QOV91584.1 SH3 domain-containing protein [Humisphaera borealis]